MLSIGDKNFYLIRLLFVVIIFLPLKLSAANLEDVVILTEEYPPYNFVGENGELEGIAVDLLIEAYAKTGIRLPKSKIKLQPWPRAYRQLLRGSNVMLFSTTRTASREKLFKWVGPISKTKIVLIAKKSRNIRIESADELAQYFIGGILNDIGIQLVTELIGFNANILTTPYGKSLAGMLELERIDLWAYEENTARLFFKRSNLNPDDYESIYTLSESELYFAFSLKTEQKIVDRLQQAINDFRNNN